MNMKNITKPAIIFTMTGLFVLSIVGCNEQQQQPTSSSKKARLVANENMQLKEQLQSLDGQIKDLQAQLQTQKDLLEDCRKEFKALKLKKQSEGEKFLVDILMSADDAEKDDLKKQIKILEEKIKQLEANK